eukprot:TRINITY_DN112621_c0_g1_i2.p1 TRINITY_DN112621_c0_g1~~TRINITY_DN112621_c0_g1_i2.p1  ORF type:complete len:328 (+),score=55.90 TRINITY_DN112621_c0_g1_i2:65-985(+)
MAQTQRVGGGGGSSASNAVARPGAVRNWHGVSEAVNGAEKFFPKLRRQLEDGSSGEVSAAIDSMRGVVWELAKDATGCRLVQLALERADKHHALALAQELKGHVREAVASPHANYVIQKVITQLCPSGSDFVAEELTGIGAKTARHRYGCRILSRLLEFCARRETTKRVVDEVLAEAPDMCRHSFGHHVVQSLLEHGSERQQGLIVKAICQDAIGNASHRSASFLVEKALAHCAPDDQQVLMSELKRPESITRLAHSQYGCYVVRALLQRQEVDAEAVIRHLRLHYEQGKLCKELLQSFEAAAASR